MKIMKTEKLKVTKQMCERAQSICNKKKTVRAMLGTKDISYENTRY